MMLSGVVAIVAADRSRVIDKRDLGPVPVECAEEGTRKPFALPLVNERERLSADERPTGPIYRIESERVVAVYGKESIPPEPETLEKRVDRLQAELEDLKASGFR